MMCAYTCWDRKQFEKFVEDRLKIVPPPHYVNVMELDGLIVFCNITEQCILK